jgi:hypothetical protein
LRWIDLKSIELVNNLIASRVKPATSATSIQRAAYPPRPATHFPIVDGS